MTFNGVDPADVTLRAAPLTLGDSYAFVRFPDSNQDLIGLKGKCPAGNECDIDYEVHDAWATGTYQGSISAYTPRGKVGETPISAVRQTIAFRPVITSEAMKDGRLVFDATSEDSFLLSVQNPAGSPPQNILLSAEPADPDCASSADISFAPSQFRLQPGSSQTVIATVAQCLKTGKTRFVTLKTADADRQEFWNQTVIALTRHQPAARRQFVLFGFVVLGSIISVLLNSIFPVNRLKNGLRNDLHRADDVLRDCVNASPALMDGLAAEAMRLRLSLQQVRSYDANKLVAMQEAQHGVASLVAASKLTQQISHMRSTVDGAILSIATHAVICGKLRDAEEALLGGDVAAATDRLTEAQAKLTEALGDVAQRGLRASLADDLPRLLRERGKLAAIVQDQAAQQNQAGGAATQQQLNQPENRHRRIRAIVDQLNRDNSDLQSLSAQEILDIERDYYVANIWTEYVEDRLDLLADPKLAGQLAAFVDLSNALLDCLLRNPKSEHAQVLLNLVRSNTTPDEIAEALARGEARIECDPRPKYLETVNISFVFTDPSLNDVVSARRLLNYFWQIDDETNPPPNVDRFRHYFRRPGIGWRWPWQPAAQEVVRTVSLKVQVPFTDAAVVTISPAQIRPRRVMGAWWRFEPMELASFTVVTAIAVVTAFGAHYAQNIPDMVTWSDYLSSFMLGFGLDQLRDTVSTSSAPSTPATAPSGPVAHA